MAKLLIGDGIARILGFVITPVLTRIYLPAEMGSLAVFTSFVAILIPFSTLRYPLLIPVLKEESSGRKSVSPALAENVFWLRMKVKLP